MGVLVKLRLTAVFDAQHGGFATGWSPVSWGLIDELFVNLTMPSRESGSHANRHASRPLRHLQPRVMQVELREASQEPGVQKYTAVPAARRAIKGVKGVGAPCATPARDAAPR